MTLQALVPVGQADITYTVTKVHVQVLTKVSALKNKCAQCLNKCKPGDLTQARGIPEGFPEEVWFEMRSEGCVGVIPTAERGQTGQRDEMGPK